MFTPQSPHFKVQKPSTTRPHMACMISHFPRPCPADLEYCSSRARSHHVQGVMRPCCEPEIDSNLLVGAKSGCRHLSPTMFQDGFTYHHCTGHLLQKKRRPLAEMLRVEGLEHWLVSSNLSMPGLPSRRFLQSSDLEASCYYRDHDLWGCMRKHYC